MKRYSFILFLVIGLQFSPDKVFSQIDISITASIAPPDLPVYEQPDCPEDGYMWTPGYWAYGDGDYYWVPGVWVSPPQIGYLWTPFYWGFENGFYRLYTGYWGRHIGFYGGVNYGYGYGGHGFGGGRWEGHHFRYNTAVMNVNTTIIHNTYIDRTVIVNKSRMNDHRSFNGGDHGTRAMPTVREQSTMKEHHVAPTIIQATHVQIASHNTNQFAAVNHGRPTTTAVGNVKASNFGHKNNPSPPTTMPAPSHSQEVAKPQVKPATSPHIQGGINNKPQKDNTSNPIIQNPKSVPTIQHHNANQSAGHNPQSPIKPPVSQLSQQPKQQPIIRQPQQVRQMPKPPKQAQPPIIRQQPHTARPAQHQPQQQAPNQLRPAQEEHGHK